MANRCGLIRLMLQVVLVVCLALLPVAAVSAEGPQGAGGADVEGAAIDERPEAPAEEAQGGAARSEGVPKETEARISVRDPVTGEVTDVAEVASEKMVELPPGDITGTVFESDGVTPQPNVRLVLVDAKTGKEFTAATTGESGEFVLEDVPVGRYALLFGNNRMAAVLNVTEGAEPGLLSIVLPKAANAPFPGWAPGWMNESPVLGVAVATGVGALLVAAPVAYFASDDDGSHGRGTRHISPTVP